MANVTVEASPEPLTAFKLLSFDVYGTLIDWKPAIYKVIVESAPFARLPSSSPFKDSTNLMQNYFDRHQRELQSQHPDMEYSELLANVYRATSKDAAIDGVSDREIEAAAKEFSNSVGDWAAFRDTMDALRKLQKHYKLVTLSNSSPSTFGASLQGPFKGFNFDKYYLASDIGSYKPNPRNFEYLLEHVKSDLGIEKTEILHVAQSLYHDHVPAAKMGLARCWVDRAGANTDEAVVVNWHIKSLEELADLVEEAFEKE